MSTTPAPAQDQLDAPQSRMTMIAKADTAGIVTNGVDSYPEDAFMGSYMTAGDLSAVAIIEPTFKPGALKALVTQNNILAQCIEAMEVNVDGTGHTIELIEGRTESEAEKQVLTDFYDEPYPNVSMISLRREARNDAESTGNGYIEVIRNAAGDVVLQKYLDACDMRLIRMDEAVTVTKTVQRAGKPMAVNLRVRERRFVQLVNGKKVYFKEFGASRDLDRDTGLWAPAGQRLGMQKRASEVIHISLNKEAKTPYGAPRWINQLPSVLGSRKAEEFNLEFFDAGGLPPLLILVQGGFLAEKVHTDLKAHLGGKGVKHRAAIVEAMPSSGSLDSTGSVKVTVERFGSDRQQDSMFQLYDKSCEEHVRVAFRLPPLFIGKAQDYNFATAQTGYMVAEAQVFAPERREFDEKMWLISRSLGVINYEYKSKPLTISSTADQLTAIAAVVGKVASGESVVEAINDITGMHLEFEKAEPPAPAGAANVATPASATTAPVKAAPKPADASTVSTSSLSQAADPSKTTNQSVSSKPKLTVVKEEDTGLVTLVAEWANVLSLDGPCTLSDQDVLRVKKSVNELHGAEQKLFNEILAAKSLSEASPVIEGMAALCGCAAGMGA